MNKLELAYYAHLQTTRPKARIYPQAITLKLGNGVRYRPDFIVVEEVTVPGLPEPVRHITAYETKGGWVTSTGKLKVKLAPERYPWITFYVVTRNRENGGWDHLIIRQ